MSAHGETPHGAQGGHGNLNQLMAGFALAALLTIVPFALVMGEVEINRTALIATIMGLGGLQILVHLIWFLHVNRSAEEGWTLAATIFAVLILVIVLAGSLWVMKNMNENMMPMHDMEHHMQMEQMKSLQSQQG
ncbi:cytochrome o ubiquinol oxidase subunit IV [Paracoccus seriniphilus]|uniref:Cytochrome bo(3) ubiquinol oxidase subunit 4 n=1 Tax=Paracoccus seriniphilus TaxID=184748 RepID=A0A239PZB2_9RHOB|nr:cytochrome o ubiquinol oxidase subunit IV [Paracoccus seriniphilus]WCR15735.1 cytochrome o ubiquinol oxidase subunit IV [Paracoccus seriniphilus]SNT75585.1 cytochrome bo3 quinol oxidase subunit 4 [Paracoccus seriniphilus]